MISVFDCVENIVGKEENAGFQHFLFFPKIFSKGIFFRVVRGRDSMVQSKPFNLHANFRLFKFSRKYRYDVKNMNEWGYNYPIE